MLPYARHDQPCRRKTKHRSLQAAYKILRKLRADEYCEDPRALNVYRCNACGRFHVGHRPAQFVK